MHTFLAHVHGRARLDQGAWYFAYISLIIEFKGIVMKLKNVSHTISVELLIFTIVFNVSQLSYKPSNFAQANKPYAVG